MTPISKQYILTSMHTSSSSSILRWLTDLRGVLQQTGIMRCLLIKLDWSERLEL